MPRRDGTGPNGMGARTGRGLGMCTGVNAPGFGRGYGAGYGMDGGTRARGGFGPGLGFRGGRGGGPGSGPSFGWRGGMGGAGWDFAPDCGAAARPDTRELLEERAAFLENELRAVRERMDELKEENSA